MPSEGPQTTAEATPESPVGKLAYWNAEVMVDGVARRVRRRGPIFAVDPKSGMAGVHTLTYIDPYCPPEQDGHRLGLFPGAWSVTP